MPAFSSGLRRRSLLMGSVSLVVPAGIAWAQAAQSETARSEADRPIVLGTSTPGGGFALYGETLEHVLNRQSGRPLLRARPTRGTAENVTLLQSGELDAALIQGTSASEIFQRGTASGLRILFAMYPSPGMLAVPAASAVRRLDDVVGQKVVFGVRTSGLVTLGRQVFSGIGLDIDRDVQALYVEQAAESPRLVLAGHAVGLWGAGEGWPGFTQLARSPGGARFIGPSAQQISRIVEKYPLLKSMQVEAGTYPGIDKPLTTVGSVNLILARADLDERRAAAFVRAMQASATELAAALPQAAFSTLANTLASAPSAELLHPAVQPSR